MKFPLIHITFETLKEEFQATEHAATSYHYETHGSLLEYRYNMARISSDIIKAAAKTASDSAKEPFPMESLYKEILRQKIIIQRKLHAALKEQVSQFKAASHVAEQKIDKYFAPLARAHIRCEGENAMAAEYTGPLTKLSAYELYCLSKCIGEGCMALVHYKSELQLLEDVDAGEWLLNYLLGLLNILRRIKFLSTLLGNSGLT